ncbi:MAG TPA: histidine kinase, partial [Acidimicrobiales bacterium]|nr:histidine kinase [Acidimicrobiales bacterium]
MNDRAAATVIGGGRRGVGGGVGRDGRREGDRGVGRGGYRGGATDGGRGGRGDRGRDGAKGALNATVRLMGVGAVAGPERPLELTGASALQRSALGWRRYILPAVFCVYLIYVARAVANTSTGADAISGYVLLAAFGVTYLVTLANSDGPPLAFWVPYAILVALFVAELPFARSAAFVLCAFIGVVTVVRLGAYAIPIVFAFTVSAILVPGLVPSWHDNFGTGFTNVTAVAIPVVALATFGFLRLLQMNSRLAEAQAEVSRLAAENERSRIARDLHDLLGHSLTTITVKAGLARKLGETNPEQALIEIAEVEALARGSLADVRAAVSGYHDVTLARELATGRELLRSAGVLADIPRAIDTVDPANSELFGWVVREGLTNVVRHARATSCAVRLS